MGVDTFGKPFFMGLQQCLHMARMHACEHQQFYSGWSMILFQSLASTHRHPLYYATITFSPFTLEGEKRGCGAWREAPRCKKGGSDALVVWRSRFGHVSLSMCSSLLKIMDVCGLVWNCLQKNLAGEANSSSACTLGCGCFWMLACVWLGLENVWDAQAMQRETLREGKRCTIKVTSRDEVSKIQKESHKENRGSTCKEDEFKSTERRQTTRTWRCNGVGRDLGSHRTRAQAQNKVRRDQSIAIEKGRNHTGQMNETNKVDGMYERDKRDARGGL